MSDKRVTVGVSVDTTEFLKQCRRALFGIYQIAQVWGSPDRYHFGVRAREITRD